VDEYGSTRGIVTLEDIIEQMVGNIEDEFDLPVPDLIVREGEGYRVNGRTHIRELLQQFPDLEISEVGVDTIGGYVTKALGRMPAVGDTINLGSYRVLVVAADSRRVQEVLLTPSEPHTEHPKQAGMDEH
jgi:CBS domain containing-hemolysin-like protein